MENGQKVLIRSYAGDANTKREKTLAGKTGTVEETAGSYLYVRVDEPDYPEHTVVLCVPEELVPVRVPQYRDTL